MKNIFSYEIGSVFTGKEIMDYCKAQYESRGSHFKEAKRIYFHYNLNPNCKYKLERGIFGPGTTSHACKKIIFVRG